MFLASQTVGSQAARAPTPPLISRLGASARADIATAMEEEERKKKTRERRISIIDESANWRDVSASRGSSRARTHRHDRTRYQMRSGSTLARGSVARSRDRVRSNSGGFATPKAHGSTGQQRPYTAHTRPSQQPVISQAMLLQPPDATTSAPRNLSSGLPTTTDLTLAGLPAALAPEKICISCKPSKVMQAEMNAAWDG